jgi:hypothetical protein
MRYRQKLFTTSERGRDRDEDYSNSGIIEMQTDCYISNLQERDTYTVYGQITLAHCWEIEGDLATSFIPLMKE